MSNETGASAGAGRPKKTLLIAGIACAVIALATGASFAIGQFAANQKKSRDWKPGEVVVGSERVSRLISGLPTATADGVNAADLSALWLAAFESVQSGACAEVTGGGVQTSSRADAPGIYFINCGQPATQTPPRWYRQDDHGVELCSDAVRCAAR